MTVATFSESVSPKLLVKKSVIYQLKNTKSLLISS
ncbi:hypothetical protein CLV81_1494 [Flagellimonas meridianipacifica]|uniref:Uncharacterized protein n=1 Tax=Flagellimonas meridianipacifica TaxID=1080225 RepID=A0A2T0MIV2_9FLAO|nr:hypothetical protein CLV81_1494 [Allomuricauda pacifica]